MFENKLNTNEIEHKKLIYNKNNPFEDNKISQNNKSKKEIQFPYIYIYIKSQHNQIKAVFENKNCKNNKKIKDSKKTLPIKLRKGSVDDIMIIKIKKKQIM